MNDTTIERIEVRETPRKTETDCPFSQSVAVHSASPVIKFSFGDSIVKNVSFSLLKTNSMAEVNRNEEIKVQESYNPVL